MTPSTLAQLTQEIQNGRRLHPEEGNVLQLLLTSELNELCLGAHRIRKHYCGNTVELCTIVNGKSGRCSEDCRYCAQSSHYSAIDTPVYGFADPQALLDNCRVNEASGVHRFSIVTAGRRLSGEEFQTALRCYRLLHSNCKVSLCASHGLLESADFAALKAAGVERYHANLETSRRFFPSICTTHSYDDKLRCISRARAAGLSICSGGIIGMGESWQDRLDLAFELAGLQVRSIPLNVLIPIPGTPLERQIPLQQPEILRTVALFRYICPEADIRLAGGRAGMADQGRRAFLSGASAAITGNMLTTEGSTIEEDGKMLQQMGFCLAKSVKKEGTP